MLNRDTVVKSYKSYGFMLERIENPKILVFTLQAGHYHNADIINLNGASKEDIEKIFRDFSEAGYACIVRDYKNDDSVKTGLFEGFFSVENTKNFLKKEYENHTKQILASLPDNSSYKYINSKYFINNKISDRGVVNEISDRLSETRPILFLIEAAAGFGKTCTAYELLLSIINSGNSTVPLFSELARNRQAKIFHYVLLDEIDRSFPNLNSNLVREQIQNGKVPVILDGFDELLHEDNPDETDLYKAYNTEPMLKTISDLLQNSAKIILTTRRTAIFDGNQFQEWVMEHEQFFDIYRIKINEPTITDWLPAPRYYALQGANYPILKLNNPVLLSYLRFITDEDFAQVVASPELIVKKYFDTMFERERKRQDLQMLPEEQESILKNIAEYFIDNNYTSEQKEILSDYIENKFSLLLEKVRKYYQAENRPTIDELLNKLTSHALLDRSDTYSEQIGFVNDFVQGHFSASSILEKPSEWLGDKIFIEPAVMATIPTNDERRYSLWTALQDAFYVLDDEELKIQTDINLNHNISFNLENNSVSGITFEDITLGKNIINTYNFHNCNFINCIFLINNMLDVTFVNSKFYNCNYEGENSSLHELGCSNNNEDLFLTYIVSKTQSHAIVEESNDDDNFKDIDIYILEKFWPKGTSSSHKHRHHNAICNTTKYSNVDLLEAIKRLKKRKILLTPDKSDFYELNYEYVTEIRYALGRQD